MLVFWKNLLTYQMYGPYADDTDLIFKTKEEKNKMVETVNAVFPSRNPGVNEDKISNQT